MEISSQFKDLNDFLAKHTNVKTEKGSSNITHTRIGDKEANVYGGAYTIPKEDLPTFYKLYYHHVFKNKRTEHLTEKQLDKDGPLLVDFDFRYNYDVEKRQHTNDDIDDMITLYLDELKEFFLFEENKPFDVFIFEKPDVNRLEDKSITKDGIHMVINIQMDHIMQQMLRDKILLELPNTWQHLSLVNTWDSIIDEGICKGTTNWQMYGSRKPRNQAYELKKHYIMIYDKKDGEFSMKEQKVSDFDLENNYSRLSAQNNNCCKFEFNPLIIDSYNKRIETKNNKPKKKTNIRIEPLDDDVSGGEYIAVTEIKNMEMLKKAEEIFLKQLLPSEHEIKETHQYALILPEKYYDPGSHLLNRQVAFALKHTDERLFITWVMVRSKASDFDFSSIPELYHQWNNYFHKKEDGVTRRSIMYWAKQDAYENFQLVKNSSIENIIEETLTSQTDFDFAQVLYQMFKDKYICTSITNKIWYKYRNHRWEPDKGLTLRLAISKDMHNLYKKKLESYTNEMQNHNPNDEIIEHIKRKSKSLCEICVKLKKTNDKNNIMREAMEIFYDKEFVKKMDSNKNLLCFNNGVIDFKEKTFRDGYPQDYISKTTNIDYIPYNKEKYGDIMDELQDFMEKLFPVKSLTKYMWEHLASCLIGTNLNQTFNIYRGSGSNGKSILTDLMSQSLGEYKGTVPITLVTEKRNGIGGTSSEIVQLKGIRYAVMQEPSKDTKINEGIMKELTGGDPVQGRALYCESEIFEPQFKLVVCTNSLFEINSNDDGTWRRIRICDFMSKFIDDDEVHTDDTKYVYKKDKTLKERLPILAPVFMSMLVKKAFETDGVVKDSEIVMAASNKYRQGQDHISAFINEMVIKTGNPNDKIKKTELSNQFKIWYQESQGSKNIPKGSEIYEYMEKKFGRIKSSGFWNGIKMNYQEESDDFKNE